MAGEAQPRVVCVEIVDPDGLRAVASEIAAGPRALQTCLTYAAVYQAFDAFVAPDATVADLTAERVRAYRDLLEGAGRSRATVPKHLAARRGLESAGR